MAILLSVCAGCDEKTPDDQSGTHERTERAPAQPERSAPSLGWRRVLGSSRSAIRSAIDSGALDCPQTDDSAEADSGSALRSKFCSLPPPSDTDRLTYHVSRVLFADDRVVALSLQPHGAVTLGGDFRAHVDLPELSVRRARTIERGKSTRPVVSHRAERLPTETQPETPVAIEFVGSGDDDALARIDIFAATVGDDLLEQLRLSGPPTVSPQIVLPASFSRDSPFADVAAQFDLDGVRLREWDDYTLRKVGDETRVDPVSLPLETTERDGGTRDWSSAVEDFIDALRSARSKSEGASSNITFGIAATHSTAVGRIEEVLLALEQLLNPSFQLTSRRIDAFDAPFTPRGSTQAINVEVRAEPTREQTDRTGRRFLNLTVHVTLEGFRLEAGQQTFPPIDGCPDPGPTICLADADRDVPALLQRAEARQREGRLEDSARSISKVVWSFDWAELYRNVRSIQKRHEGAGYLYVSADPGVPVAVLARLFDVTGYRFRADGTESCGGSFERNADLREAEPCTTPDGELRRLFARPIWQLRP